LNEHKQMQINHRKCLSENLDHSLH